MYFLTAKDEDYQIKGSRDPLGFQVLWQAAGREVIPYISTVSNSVMDYQILLLGHAAKNYLNISDDGFIPFFIKLEQLLAYVRYRMDDEKGFNGIESVKKKYTSSGKSLYIGLEDQILSNQKSYGIWGKYINSFRKMLFDKNRDLLEIYKDKIELNPFCGRKLKTFARDVNQSHRINKDDLEEWEAMIAPPKGKERKILIDNLLQSTCSNELLRLFKEEPDISRLSLYEILDYSFDNSENNEFKRRIKTIKDTEQVLSPLNRIFRYLQTRSYWSWEDIENNVIIDGFKNSDSSEDFMKPEMRMLAGLMTLSNKEMLLGISAQNDQVATARNSAPWFGISDSGLEVYHFEGEFFTEDYDYSTQNDFSYFIGTYQRLFRELHPN